MTDKEKSALQKEIVDSLPLKPTGRLLLAPRVGKSRVVINIIKKNKPKSILWVTPSSQLATVDIPAEFVKWKATSYSKKLTTVTFASLNKIKGHYEFIIIDEEQKVTLNNFKNLLDKTLTYDYLISMTGTATKHDDKQDLYKKLGLKVLYDLNINTAVDIGMLANYEINVVEVEMLKDRNITAGSKEKPFLTTEEANYQYIHNQTNTAIFQKRKDMMFRILHRMRTVYNSPAKLKVAKHLISTLEGKKLVFCATIKQSEELCEHTYNSTTDDSNLLAFNEDKISTIGMVNSGGIGYTYKNIDHLILVQSDSDKNGEVCQKISRSLLQQKDYKATIWIICLMRTQDEKWVASALESFDKKRINYINFKNLRI